VLTALTRDFVTCRDPERKLHTPDLADLWSLVSLFLNDLLTNKNGFTNASIRLNCGGKETIGRLSGIST
jgi:hypothetical protein